MGEVKDIVDIYLKDSDILEEKAKEVSHSLEENIKNIIPPGSYGYDTGALHDSIASHPSVSWPAAVVIGSYHKDYGKYIDQGTRRGIKAVKFMEKGLKKTLEMYR